MNGIGSAGIFVSSAGALGLAGRVGEGLRMVTWVYSPATERGGHHSSISLDIRGSGGLGARHGPLKPILLDPVPATKIHSADVV